MSKREISQETIDFYVSQIKKTKEIVNKFTNMEEFSPTMLLNSLLSLVILPCEDAKRRDNKRIFPGKYRDLIKKTDIAPTVFQPIASYKDGKIKWEPKTIYAFVRKLRNGIAHQNISVSVDSDRIVYIQILNKFTNKECVQNAKAQYEEKGIRLINGSLVDFEINLTINQLKKVALFIADSYLKAIEGED